MNKKCYISAPANFDITKVEKILDELKVEYFSFYDFDIGSSFSELIVSKIKNADFVIAIINSESLNVMYELGAAESLGKPAFILLEKNFKAPFFLNKNQYYRTDFREDRIIQIAIKNFIYEMTEVDSISVSSHLKERELSSSDRHELLTKLKNSNTKSEREIFYLVKDLFIKLGIQNTSANTNYIDKGADFILRNKLLAPYLGDLIFVELKIGSLTSSRLKETANQLYNQLIHSQATGGIILYWNNDNSKLEFPVMPQILCFELVEFINGIFEFGFEKFIIRKRNHLAHGQNF